MKLTKDNLKKIRELHEEQGYYPVSWIAIVTPNEHAHDCLERTILNEDNVGRVKVNVGDGVEVAINDGKNRYFYRLKLQPNGRPMLEAAEYWDVAKLN